MSACAFGLVAASGLGGRTRARPERRWEREGEGKREGGESRPAAAPRRWRRGEERRGEEAQPRRERGAMGENGRWRWTGIRRGFGLSDATTKVVWV